MCVQAVSARNNLQMVHIGREKAKANIFCTQCQHPHRDQKKALPLPCEPHPGRGVVQGEHLPISFWVLEMAMACQEHTFTWDFAHIGIPVLPTAIHGTK